MAFRAYLPQRFATSHENVFFREFTRHLRNRYQTQDGTHALLGNISCMGHQIDAVYIASGKIIVIDFKNYGGRLEFSENGNWRIWNDEDFVFVSGGGGIKNPYQQVNAYRHSIRLYLKNKESEILSENHPECDWHHTKACVLFHKPIQLDSNVIPDRLQIYFSICDSTTIYDWIDDTMSQGLLLDGHEVEGLLRAFDLRDENLFDEKSAVEDIAHSLLDDIGSQRLELIKKLTPKTPLDNDCSKILTYYHTLVNLERFKEPKVIEPHAYEINWSNIQETLEIDIERNRTFHTIYQQNNHQQFKKNIFVGLNVQFNNLNVPLFHTVLLANDITNHRQVSIQIADLALNTSILENRGLSEGEVEQLVNDCNKSETLAERLKIVRDSLGVVVELSSSIILGLSEENIVTSQLLSELKSLIRLNSAFEGQLVQNFLLKTAVPTYTESVPKSLVYITALNGQQRRAVELAFSQPLTVITGPPGTGKTQVVINILANAVLEKKKVLFASKNNKAVDNVKQKLSKLLKEPNFFLRFGSKNEVREKVRPTLDQFTNRVSHRLFADNADKLEDLVHQNVRLNIERRECTERVNALPILKRTVKETQHKVAKIQSEYDKWVEKHRDFLSKDLRATITSLEKSTHKELKRLRKCSTGLKKVWFNIFLLKKSLIQAHKLRQSLPTFFLAPEMAIKEADHSVLFAFYSDVKKQIDKTHQIFTQKVQYEDQLTAETSRLESLQSQYERLKTNRASYCARIEEIDSELPGIGVPLMDELIHNTLFRANEAELQRYLDYIPDNIPWQDDQLPSFELATNDFLGTFNAISVTNLSIKNGVPLTEGLFDLAVIDEASQCDIASAIPLIYRAKQLVVIGDPLQLKHITKVQLYEERYLQEHLGLTKHQLDYGHTSLYDYCDSLSKISRSESVLLLEHFRCHPQIISYSNEIFYKVKFGQELVIKTKETEFDLEPKGIYWINTVGNQHATQNSNHAEIDKAIALATSLANKYPQASIGITTPFRDQATGINERLPSKIRTHVTADTVHKYQGDEKDIMILSLVISENCPQGKLNWINHAVPYLINVAVTRARSTLYIIGNARYCMKLPGTTPLGFLVRYVHDLKQITN